MGKKWAQLGSSSRSSRFTYDQGIRCFVSVYCGHHHETLIRPNHRSQAAADEAKIDQTMEADVRSMQEPWHDGEIGGVYVGRAKFWKDAKYVMIVDEGCCSHLSEVRPSWGVGEADCGITTTPNYFRKSSHEACCTPGTIL